MFRPRTFSNAQSKSDSYTTSPQPRRNGVSPGGRIRKIAGLALGVGFLASSLQASQHLKGHVLAAVRGQTPLARMAATTNLDLAISLPLRNQDQLKAALDEMYRPGSPSYHKYLTPEDFAAAYGPTEQDYQAVLTFAKTHHLKVTGTHANRTLVDVNGSVADIENAFHVRMGLYQHPKDARSFFAPDSEPTVDIQTPLLKVSGLNNFTLPKPHLRKHSPDQQRGEPKAGSGSGGSYQGNDFRAAYAPGVSLTGTGQSVGLFELDGYPAADIAAYATLTGLANVPLQNVLVDGYNGSANKQAGDDEVCLDIEMVMAMSPGVSSILVYEASPSSTTANINDLLNRMATDNKAKQLSCSWGFDIDAATEQIFQQYAAQGQSFFLASGDNAAFVGPVLQPSDDPYVICVGGTELSTTGPGGSYTSETVWSDGQGSGSSGGISITYPIPVYQQGMSMLLSRGSTTMRNVPDVAMLGHNVWVIANGAGAAYDGTSIAAPLWAAFTALVNQQGASQGLPPVGFINPTIYAIGKSSQFSTAFHDITTGNNEWSGSPNLFPAVHGYDLCTGWGSPAGSNMIQALLSPPVDSLAVTPSLGFTAIGPVHGPFNTSSRTFTLTNSGSAAINWGIVNTSALLTVTPSSGTLNPGGASTTVIASLNTTASNLLIENDVANIWFTNMTDGAAQPRQFTLLVGNGGFETSDFADWNFSGNSADSFTLSTDDSANQGDQINGVDDSAFVHSGLYGAFLGQTGSAATLSQTLPTTAGAQYVVSFWLTSIADPANGTTPNQFFANWGGKSLYNQSNLGAFGWTNMQFTVTASSSTTALQFGFRDDPAGLGLDDVSVKVYQPIVLQAPSIQSVTLSSGSINLTWSAQAGHNYQVQFATDLSLQNWTNLGGAQNASGGTLSASDSTSSGAERFYRVVATP